MNTRLRLQQLVPSFLLTSTISILVAVPAFAQVIEVTGVRVISTQNGVDVILETDSQTIPQVSTTSSEKTLVTDIFNTQLRLPNNEEFRQEKPAEGIESVTVTQLSPNTIRVTVTGTQQIPKVQINPSSLGIVLSLNTPKTTPKPDEEIEILVRREIQNEYVVPNTTTGMLTDIPLRDIPQSIQVIPQRVIQDQQAISIEEVVGNVSAVTFLGETDGRGPRFSIRGFDDAPILRDGFLFRSGSGGLLEVQNLSRVEVLKGPSSILSGDIEPGGIINVVRKRPLSEPFYNLQFQVGNRNFVRPSLDISGPLTADRSLLYRLNALYLNEGSFRDFDSSYNRFSIAPVLTWKIGDRTEINFIFEYIKDDNPADFGTVAFGNSIANIPRGRVTNDPSDVIQNTFSDLGYDLEHRFSDNWKLRNAFRFTHSSFNYGRNKNDVIVLPAFLDEETGILTRFFADQFGDTQNYNLLTNIQGNFSTGSIRHTVIFGFDLGRVNTYFETTVDFNNPSPLNIFNPVYGTIPKPNANTLSPFDDQRTQQDRLGIYVQDQVKLLDNLIVLAGIRYDTVKQTITSNISESRETQYNDAFTPRIGIVYQPIEAISLYGSYSRSFAPNSVSTVEGDLLNPEEGEGFEVGIKAQLMENRLFATLAYFDITKQNVAVPDPNEDLPGFFIATGKERSRGVEFDLTGRILPGWNIIASYAFVNAKVTADTDSEIVGNRLVGIPQHSASLWTTYEIQTGSLQGLGFGMGFNFVGEREGDITNTFQADSFFLMNAAIFYRRNNWRAQINFNNLFNANYIEAIGRSSRVREITPGEPFTVRALVSVEF
ncbi:TonB-dependent siderophore receptor [Floridanema evergladense]|uniref:TonB-dependent siderophore receptor n=1 Tax=Floridaenema evergladense BLCC-F167 TaxID=3153639 RepID=A0ABV4WV79_9CYAN